jgi:hypothetical protein
VFASESVSEFFVFETGMIKCIFSIKKCSHFPGPEHLFKHHFFAVVFNSTILKCY